jgi:hypothetical protein
MPQQPSGEAMKILKRYSFLIVAVVLAAASFPLRSAVPPPPPAPEPDPDRKQESVEVRFARAQLQFAEVSLKQVQQLNKHVSGAVAQNTVAQYEQDVEVAKALVQAADHRPGQQEDLFPVWLRRADAEAKSAEAQWRSAAAANRRAPGAYAELEVERLRLRAELARLRFEHGQALADKSPEARLQWQLGMLAADVERLKDEVFRNGSQGRAIYPWWW